ncbi:RiPP maturation radical SAM C-methyltransferase [Pseudoalteromonas sp. XMcav1-K]|uniref:RiPP maturation radical SAM C-methyltransferase n=1 Tax=Pseudoalteromonas sp. XMcav1-K TaxID=3374372 RepID=UPI0037563C41
MNERVSVVVMPWAMVQEPALGPSILSASLKRERINVKVEYCNLKLLKYLKFESYTRVADVFALNDFIFSGVLDNSFTSHQEEILEDIVNSLWSHNNDWVNDERFACKQDVFNYILQIRNKIIPKYLMECAESILEFNPDLVAFSCLFDQTIPSLALSKLINEINPSISIAFGGYALKGPIGKNILDAFNFVDSVVTGPGENEIVRLAKYAHNKKRSIVRHLDVSCREPQHVDDYPIENSPAPDFDDYEDILLKLDSEEKIKVDWRVVPYETSRGCWWGVKSHCVFCGIDKEDLTYTYKSRNKVLFEVASNTDKHSISTVRFIDYILPHQYYDDLLPELSGKKGINFTCELKSNINSEKMDKLKKAGFAEIQPGIETFSTKILKRMKKGVTAAQNIFTMKLGLQSGIIVHYNFLFGFPFDDEESYETMIDQIPSLFHLQPPATVVEVLTTRFAPLQKGLVCGVSKSEVPHRFYNLIFSKGFIDSTKFSISDYCYYFEQQYDVTPKLRESYQLIISLMQQWNSKFYGKNNSFLIYEINENGCFEFLDTRNESVRKFSLDAIASNIYKELETKIRGLNYLIDTFEGRYTSSQVRKAISTLLQRKLVFQDDNTFVGLGLPRGALSNNRALEMAETVGQP